MPQFLGCITPLTQAAVLLILLEYVHHQQLETAYHVRIERRMFSQLDELPGSPEKAAFKETEVFAGPWP